MTLLLASELPAHGFEPVILCPEHGEFTRVAANRGIEVSISAPGSRWRVYGKKTDGIGAWLSPAHLWQLIGYWWRLRRELRRLRIALLHCNDLRAVIMAAMSARLAGIPAIWHLHVAPGRGMRRWLDATLAAITTHRVLVSPAMLAQWTLPPWLLGKHSVIPNGLAELASATPAPRNDGDPLLLVVGALAEHKGQDVMIRAMVRLRSEFPRACLWLAGRDWSGGAYEQKLRSLIEHERLDTAVVLLGQRDDVASLMAAADIVLIPSRSESFGMVALEAMAQSKAVVASRTGGLTNIVVDAETGLLVEPDDPAALADAVVALLRDPHRMAQMGLAGRRRADAEFSATRMTARFASLYASLT